MVNTLTFNLGESLLLSGCRACYKRNEDEVYSIRNRPCQTCFNDNEILYCGSHPQSLNKIQELQNLESCPLDEQKWHLSYNNKIKTFEFKAGECGGSGSIDCCINPINESKTSDPFDNFDKKLFIHKVNNAVSNCVLREIDPCGYVDGCELPTNTTCDYNYDEIDCNYNDDIDHVGINATFY